MGNYVIARVGNYVIVKPSALGNFVIADTFGGRWLSAQIGVDPHERIGAEETRRVLR
jgi:hypothetical protein